MDSLLSIRKNSEKKKLLLLMLRFASPDVSLSFNFRVYRLVQREELMKLIGSRRKERLNWHGLRIFEIFYVSNLFI